MDYDQGGWGVGTPININYMDMSCCKGYGFQAVQSGIGLRNQRVLV